MLFSQLFSQRFTIMYWKCITVVISQTWRLWHVLSCPRITDSCDVVVTWRQSADWDFISQDVGRHQTRSVPAVQKSSPILNYEHWAWSWSRFLGSQPTGDLGCHYFPPGLQLLSQPEIIPVDRYQIILLGDRGTQVYCPRFLYNSAQPGLEPATCKSQVRCPTNSANPWIARSAVTDNVGRHLNFSTCASVVIQQAPQLMVITQCPCTVWLGPLSSRAVKTTLLRVTH